MADLLTELQAFCAAGEVRRYVARVPWTVGDWTYATDTKIGVRVRAIMPPYEPADGSKYPPIETLKQWDRFPLGDDAASFPEVEDDPPQACPECRGSCTFEIRGEHSNHLYSWDCENCGCDGKVPGKGRISLGGATFRQRHAYLISNLRTARYVVAEFGASKYLLFETPDGKQGILASLPDGAQ